ncbi:hypothetical protein MRX96_001531 [Rhipicephalus microplus]
MTALAVSKQVCANADGLTVYPIVYEDREDKQKKLVVFDYDYSLELQKASVLAPRVLLRDYTENGVKDRYEAFPTGPQRMSVKPLHKADKYL